MNKYKFSELNYCCSTNFCHALNEWCTCFEYYSSYSMCYHSQITSY